MHKLYLPRYVVLNCARAHQSEICELVVFNLATCCTDCDAKVIWVKCCYVRITSTADFDFFNTLVHASIPESESAVMASGSDYLLVW